MPEGAALWLRRVRCGSDGAELGDGWVLDDRESLRLLADYAGRGGDGAYLEDVWAAVGHRAFAYRWRLESEVGERRREAFGRYGFEKGLEILAQSGLAQSSPARSHTS